MLFSQCRAHYITIYVLSFSENDIASNMLKAETNSIVMLGIIEVRITVDRRSASLILLKRWYDLLRSDFWEDFNDIYTENY